MKPQRTTGFRQYITTVTWYPIKHVIGQSHRAISRVSYALQLFEEFDGNVRFCRYAFVFLASKPEYVIKCVFPFDVLDLIGRVI